MPSTKLFIKLPSTKLFSLFDVCALHPEGTEQFTEAMQVYYNYIRPHQGIGGLTPSQMAHIPIDLTGNRWMKMIEMASG